MRRKFLHISQEKLADGIEISFQQIQKYELGRNRISASMIYKVAKILAVPPEYFFEGLETDEDEISNLTTEKPSNRFLVSSEGFALSISFPKIKSDALRRQVLDLIHEMAKLDE